MAEYISKASKAKIPMTAKEAAILVQQDLKAIKSSVYRDATAEQLIEMLGEDGLQKLSAYDVAKLKDPMSNIRTPEQQGDPAKPRDRSSGRYTSRQWANVKRGMPAGPK
jgi:cytochrome c553